jgi:hypothetical protein
VPRCAIWFSARTSTGRGTDASRSRYPRRSQQRPRCRLPPRVERLDVLGGLIHEYHREGADARRGSGLIGLADRVDALEGTIEVLSPLERNFRVMVRASAMRPGRLDVVVVRTVGR